MARDLLKLGGREPAGARSGPGWVCFEFGSVAPFPTALCMFCVGTAGPFPSALSSVRVVPPSQLPFVCLWALYGLNLYVIVPTVSLPLSLSAENVAFRAASIAARRNSSFPGGL